MHRPRAWAAATALGWPASGVAPYIRGGGAEAEAYVCRLRAIHRQARTISFPQRPAPRIPVLRRPIFSSVKHPPPARRLTCRHDPHKSYNPLIPPPTSPSSAVAAAPHLSTHSLFVPQRPALPTLLDRRAPPTCPASQTHSGLATTLAVRLPPPDGPDRCLTANRLPRRSGRAFWQAPAGHRRESAGAADRQPARRCRGGLQREACVDTRVREQAWWLR